MTEIVENKNGLYDLLGIANTHVLPANKDNIIFIRVDPANTEEQILAYTKKVKELLPDNKILVLPNNVSVEYFDERWWTNEGAMVARIVKEKTNNQVIDALKGMLVEQGFTFTDDGRFIPPEGYVAQSQNILELKNETEILNH